MSKGKIVTLLLIPFAVYGCAGAGGGSLGGDSPFAATYKTNFTRGSVANTSMVIFIDDQGHAGIQINNATEVEWAGQGTLIGNSLNVSLQPVAGDVSGNVLCQGTVIASGNIDLTLSGAFSATPVAVRLSGPGINPAAGSYNGTYSGSESGTFSIIVSATGNITGTLNSPSAGNNLPIEGTMGLNGQTQFQFHVTGVDGSYEGYIFLPPNTTPFQANGTWSFNSSSGTWSASQVVP